MTFGDKDRLDQRLPTRFLLFCGAIGPLLFVVVFLIEGAIRPGYNAWYATISTLSLAHQGWVQIANFSLFGLLMLGFAIGLKVALGATGPGSLWGPLLLFIVGLGLITDGLFVPDPILGYPPGFVSNGPASLHGMIHNLAALVVFLALPSACFVMGRRFACDSAWRGWALYSIATGVLVLVFVAWFQVSVVVATHIPNGGSVPPGLLERLLVIIGCCWLSLLALRLFCKRAPREGEAGC